MNGSRAAALCAAVTFGATAPSAAQVERNTKPFTPFRVNIVNGILNTTMPFDAKFIVWGDVPAGTTDVIVDIRTLVQGTQCTAAGTSTPKQHAEAKTRKWKAEDYADHGATAPQDLVTRTELQFELLIEELEPSKLYCFEFQLKPGRPITPEEAATFSVMLLPAYRAFIRGIPPTQ